jgi:hypothetical protein
VIVIIRFINVLVLKLILKILTNTKMKKIILIMLTLTFAYAGSGFATNPAYTLTTKNFVLINPNTAEFEIYLKHTNPGQSTPFNLLLGQYYMYFNTAYANGGTLTYSVAPGNPNQISDLPPTSQPRSPMVFNNILRIAPNSIVPVSNSPVISSSGDGTKILKLRLQTTASSFSGNLDLRWKNSGGASTNISAYANGVPVKVTDSTGHTINTSSGTPANIKLATEGLFNQNTNKLNMRDTVIAYLRNSSSPYAVVDVSKAVVDSLTLTGNFNFANAPSGTYYIVVKHRNSIETWSKTGGQPFTAGSTLNYDFTTAASQSYGSNLKLVGSKYCIYSGDVNQDGAVDLNDISMIDNDVYNLVMGYVLTDLTGDNFVDASDMSIADNNGFNFVGVMRP